eukprot:1146841-Pelagomonas_calceolata.AAC.5
MIPCLRWQVSVGCGMLEEALHLLQPLAPGRDFIAPRLAREIKLGLVELQSHEALEQVWQLQRCAACVCACPNFPLVHIQSSIRANGSWLSSLINPTRSSYHSSP